jgi:amino acid transporter
MTFREKIDWLTLGITALAFGWYALVYPWGLRGVPALAAQGGLLLLVAIVMTIALTMAAIALAIHRPRDANAPTDERDRDITRRASARAYFVLIVGAAGCFVLGYWTADLAMVLNGLLASVVAAELVRLASQVAAYRMGD